MPEMTRLEPEKISVRELTEDDIGFIANYWLNSDQDFLIGMGVDLEKLPSEKDLREMLMTQIHLPDTKRSSLALILDIDGRPSGHCNVNGISYGEEATMHLHIWNAAGRRKGIGTRMVLAALPVFFDRLKLQTIWCEPYAENPAPNRTLAKAGFEFVKKHRTVPGSLNFEQEVNRYKLSREKFESMRKTETNGVPG